MNDISCQLYEEKENLRALNKGLRELYGYPNDEDKEENLLSYVRAGIKDQLDFYAGTRRWISKTMHVGLKVNGQWHTLILQENGEAVEISVLEKRGKPIALEGIKTNKDLHELLKEKLPKESDTVS